MRRGPECACNEAAAHNGRSTMTVKIAAVIALSAGIALAAPARANLIVNGDFENLGLWGAWFFDANAAGGGSGPATLNYGIRDASGFGNRGPANRSYVGGLEWS